MTHPVSWLSLLRTARAPLTVVALAVVALVVPPQSSDMLAAVGDDAHAVGLDDRDLCLRGDEFAFGHNIYNVISETRFAAGSQDGDRGALHSGRQCERSRKLSRCASERWTGRI